MSVAVPVGLAALALLIALGAPIGLAMMISGVLGLVIGLGVQPAVMYLGTSLYREGASFVLLAIPMFILMGAIGSHARLWDRLFDCVYALVGRIRDGMAMAMVGAGTLLGAASGSSTANAAALGKATIGEAERFGYRRRTVLACVAASATTAVMIPPSITLIVYAVLTEKSVARLFAAGVIPGLVSAAVLMSMIAFMARRRPEDMPAGPRLPWGRRLGSTARAAPIMAVVVLVIGGIYAGLYTPTEASAVGVLGMAVIGLVLGRLGLPEMFEAAKEAVRTSAMIFLIVAGAFVFGRFISVTGVPGAVASTISHLPVNRWLILALLLVVYLVLGAFMDQLAIQVLTIPVVFPVIEALHFDPYWFAIVFVKTVEIGLITPPLGLNIYVVSGVANVPVEEGFAGVTPFLVADVILLVLLAAFPQVSLFLPDLLLGKA